MAWIEENSSYQPSRSWPLKNSNIVRTNVAPSNWHSVQYMPPTTTITEHQYNIVGQCLIIRENTLLTYIILVHCILFMCNVCSAHTMTTCAFVFAPNAISHASTHKACLHGNWEQMKMLMTG